MTAAIYARVSTDDQRCDLQLAELQTFAGRMGWPTVEYIEKASGKANSRRPVLAQLLADARLRKFDIVLVWKMDRFGRSLSHLLENIQHLDRAGIRFIAPSQSIDTDQKSAIGKLLLHVLGAVAEFERDLIRDRVSAGVKEYSRAIAAGRVGKDVHSKSGKDLPTGRPRRIFRRDRVDELRAKGVSWRAIAAELGVPVSTIRPRRTGRT